MYEIKNDINIKNPGMSPYSSAKMKGMKISMNANIVSATGDKKVLLIIVDEIQQITGQRPKPIKAKDSVAAFRIRKNMEIGLIVTLRGKKLQAFIKKLQVGLSLIGPKCRTNVFGIRNINPLINLSSTYNTTKSPKLNIGALIQLNYEGRLSNSNLYPGRLGLPS